MSSAVIFDVEGTLIDFTEYHVLSFGEAIRKRYPVEFTMDDLLAGYGTAAWRILDSFFRRNGLEVSESECRQIVLERNSIALKYADKVKVLPGAREILSSLKAAVIPMAIASSSPAANVDFMLKGPGLWDYFKAVVTVEDVPEAKPDPKIFLVAAGRMGASPKDCIVFEDSTHGVKAAKAAGMKVIAVLTGGTKKEALAKEKPDLIIENLNNISVGGVSCV